MLLEMNNLSVSYPEFTLHPVSFALDAGEMLTIVGESGSGKTTLARAIACLSEPEAQVSGQVYLNGRELLAMDERARRPLRMKEFALSFQNSAEWLNPSLTLAEHLREVLCRAYRGAAMAARMEELMALVGLETADLERYPRELSGGMVQKFLLANALALNPALVLLDEPTGALDIASSRGITALIQELNRRLGTAFLVITHDMKLAADLGGRTVVLYDGHVEEAGDTRALLDHPRHPYTRGLLQSAVGLNPVRDMWGIRPTTVSYTRQPHGCPFYGRCTQSLPACAGHAPELTAQPDGRLLACNRGGVLTLLECRGLCKAFGRQRVLDGIDLTLYSGEIVSLVGRSGAGKTTLARTLAGLLPLEGGGSVEFQGKAADFAALHRRLGGVQMVLQDSQAALNPRMTVREAHATVRLLSGRGGGAGAGGRGPFRLRQLSHPAHPRPVRRPAAAGGHCPRPDHGAGPPHCRRAHLHAGPLGQGQPAADAQGPAEQPGLLHAVHHPRSGQRPEDLRPSLPPGGGDAHPAEPQRLHSSAL